MIELVSEQTEDAKKSSNTAFSYHMRAVLLTWNIRIRGIKDDLWNDILPDMLVFLIYSLEAGHLKLSIMR